MKLRIAATVFLAMSASACVRQVALQTQFNNSDFEFAAKPGKATITGQAFFRRKDGVVVYAAGNPVSLIPVNAYTMEIMTESRSSAFSVKITNSDPRLKNYIRQTTANREGRFTFTGVPDGPYVVATRVTWMAGDAQQSGDLTQQVAISNGQNVNLIISQQGI
jgi:hypothetical protein